MTYCIAPSVDEPSQPPGIDRVGAAGLVIGHVVISDLTRGRAPERAFGLLILVGSAAPVVAPFLGRVLMGSMGWCGVFDVVLGIGVVGLMASALVMPESYPPAARGTSQVPRYTVPVQIGARRAIADGGRRS